MSFLKSSIFNTRSLFFQMTHVFKQTELLDNSLFHPVFGITYLIIQPHSMTNIMS